MKYSEKLKDPRWQKKRLEIFQRDGWACRGCQDTENTLAVHHNKYLSGKDPWDYPNELLFTLCEECHEAEREHRPFVEQALLEFLRDKGFLRNEVGALNYGLRGLKMVDTPAVVADALAWAMRDTNIMRSIVFGYQTNHAKAPEGKG